jgi:hypothetical protein
MGFLVLVGWILCPVGSVFSEELQTQAPAATRDEKPAETESAATESKAPTTKLRSVELVIDYGDGVQKRFLTIPWREKMTVQQAMEYAGKHKRGIKYDVRGKGATALLWKIDDLKNEGMKGLNWIFRVNKKLGDRSFAVSSIEAGDTILWKFDKYK